MSAPDRQPFYCTNPRCWWPNGHEPPCADHTEDELAQVVDALRELAELWERSAQVFDKVRTHQDEARVYAQCARQLRRRLP